MDTNQVTHRIGESIEFNGVVTHRREGKVGMLFADYFKDFLETLNDGSRTFGSKMDIAPHIIRGLGSYRMYEINKAVIRKFLNDFSSKTYGKKLQYYSQSTINKIFDLLHSVIIEASDEEGDRILRTDFMAKLEKPRSKKHSSEKEHVFTDAEIKAVMKALKSAPMVLCWIHLLADTGIRPSEALALKFSDINYTNSTISIFRTISRVADYDVKNQIRTSRYRVIIKDLKNETNRHKKNYQRRTLKVSASTLDVLCKWQEDVKGNSNLMELKVANNTEEYLFCGTKGKFWQYDDYKQLYERTLDKNELNGRKMNPYRYRHTVCTDLLRQGVDIKTVQLILGDNTPDMVLRVYANMNKEDVLKGSQVRADRMDILLGVIETTPE